MTRTARYLYSVLLACAATVSCSDEQKQIVGIGGDANNFTLTLQTMGIKGLCYAPQSISFNGYLSLDGFDHPNSWKAVSAGPAQVDGLNNILSARRVMIGGDGLTLSVPKDAVIKRPFDLQFLAFPCDAPQRVKAGMAKVQIVSVTADLPPFAGGVADGTMPR